VNPPKKLLTQNSELKPDGIFNWTLPAFAIKLTDGSNFNVCPQAGACASFVMQEMAPTCLEMCARVIFRISNM
jgi:hypothetical protein